MREGADWMASMAGISTSSVKPAVVFCLSGSGYFKYVLGDREVGRLLADRAVELSDELVDSKTRGWVHHMRAAVHLFSGDFAAGERDARLAVASADETDVDGLRALARMLLGAALLSLGETGAAGEQLRQALVLARTLQECWVTGFCLAFSGQLAMQCDEHALAESQLQESIRLFERIDNHTSILRPANLLGQLALRQGDSAKARLQYERNLITAHAAGWLEHLASALGGLAMAAVLSKQYEQAAQLFGAAHSLRSSAGLDPPPLQKHDEERQIATIRANLVESVFEATWQRGTTMTTDEAVAYARGLSPR
jgi:tetratricopeptide (TPR) repeat protein